MMQGETLNSVAKGIDINSYRTPLGVCGGIAPFNFPVMIPLWMFPMAITCGNTYVMKVIIFYNFYINFSHLKELQVHLYN